VSNLTQSPPARQDGTDGASASAPANGWQDPKQALLRRIANVRFNPKGELLRAIAMPTSPSPAASSPPMLARARPREPRAPVPRAAAANDDAAEPPHGHSDVIDLSAVRRRIAGRRAILIIARAVDVESSFEVQCELARAASLLARQLHGLERAS
jgi:hypothetical protein